MNQLRALCTLALLAAPALAQCVVSFRPNGRPVCSAGSDEDALRQRVADIVGVARSTVWLTIAPDGLTWMYWFLFQSLTTCDPIRYESTVRRQLVLAVRDDVSWWNNNQGRVRITSFFAYSSAISAMRRLQGLSNGLSTQVMGINQSGLKSDNLTSPVYASSPDGPSNQEVILAEGESLETTVEGGELDEESSLTSRRLWGWKWTTTTADSCVYCDWMGDCVDQNGVDVTTAFAVSEKDFVVDEHVTETRRIEARAAILRSFTNTFFTRRLSGMGGVRYLSCTLEGNPQVPNAAIREYLRQALSERGPTPTLTNRISSISATVSIAGCEMKGVNDDTLEMLCGLEGLGGNSEWESQVESMLREELSALVFDVEVTVVNWQQQHDILVAKVGLVKALKQHLNSAWGFEPGALCDYYLHEKSIETRIQENVKSPFNILGSIKTEGKSEVCPGE